MKILGFIRDTSHEAMLAYEYYRIYLPLRAVAEHCSDIEVNIIDRENMQRFPDADIANYDLYVVSRVYGADIADMMQVLQRYDVQMIFDADDDLTDDIREWGNGEAFKETLRCTDYVTVTTPALAKHFAQYTQRPPIVLPNHLDVEWFQRAAQDVQRFVPGLTAGFSGTRSHWGDWQCAMPALRNVDVRPVMLGYTPPYALDLPGVVKIEQVPYRFYPGFLQQIDILLCALEDTEWNRGKSGVKALEAMALGIVPLCSPSPAYTALYDAGAPVVIVSDWEEALSTIVGDTGRREALSAEGPQWVAEHRDMSTGWQLWADHYRAVVASL